MGIFITFYEITLYFDITHAIIYGRLIHIKSKKCTIAILS